MDVSRELLFLLALPPIIGIGFGVYVWRKKPHWKDPLLWAAGGAVFFQLFLLASEPIVRWLG